MQKPTSYSIGFISDQETKVDLLNNEAIAKTIINLIEEHQKNPITIGVHGDWGAGKSSILEMIESSMSSKEKVLCIKFNGWQFQGFEDAKIAVIEGIVSQLIEKRSLYTKASDEVKEILERIDWLKVAKKAGGLAFTAVTGIPSFDSIETVVQGVKNTLATITAKDVAEKTKEVGSALTLLVKDKPESHSVPKEIQEFRKAFEKLLEKSEVSRLVVLVDDLDRCLPETAIETLEAIRLFVFLPKTVFIVGADEAMIEYSVRKHFPDLPESNSSQGYARNYLEKLIQVPLRIPALGEAETRIYITLLLLEGALAGQEEDYKNILELGRKALQKPWEGKSIEAADVKGILKSEFDKVQPLLLVAEQISPMLSYGTKGNPRQIKRFLNALSIRLRLAKERGFGDAINDNTLAKLMLAELFLPPAIFEHIAVSVANSSDGICKELNAIEEFNDTANAAKDNGKAKTKDAVDDKPENQNFSQSIVEDWKTRGDVLNWAKIEPKLGSKSLKPYLFVIKDKKNYLNISNKLPEKLLVIFNKLIADEANIRAVSGSLEGLSLNEADALFNELRLKILASENFMNRPDGILGMVELVKKRPALQARYIELLEELPIKKIGVWAAGGHEQVITEPTAKEKLSGILDKWQAQSTSGPLKTALSTRKK